MAKQLTKADANAELEKARRENSALCIALSTPGAYYQAGHANIHVAHYAPMRADGGAVLVRWDGRHSWPTAMFGCEFEAHAHEATRSAMARQDFDEADFWTKVRFHIRQNMHEALALAAS